SDKTEHATSGTITGPPFASVATTADSVIGGASSIRDTRPGARFLCDGWLRAGAPADRAMAGWTATRDFRSRIRLVLGTANYSSLSTLFGGGPVQRRGGKPGLEARPTWSSWRASRRSGRIGVRASPPHARRSGLTPMRR